MVAVIAGSLCSASQAAALTACEAIKPTIGHVLLTEASAAGAVFEAQINPQNSATTYEFVIVQQLRNPENPSDHGEPAPEGLRTVGGPIPTGAGDVTVSGRVTGLERGDVYWYEVVASNLAGETRSGAGANVFSYFYTGGFPYGTPGVPFRPVQPSPCELELTQQEAQRIAAQAEAERQQRSRENGEEKAKEASARYASEVAALEQREKEGANAGAASHILCIVPALEGDELRTARQAIDKSHCRLGEVREPHAVRGILTVVGQSDRHGEKLAGGTVIDVTMGTARLRHRRPS